MRNLLLAATYWLLATTALFAQDSIVVKFVRRSYTFQGVTLPYRMFIPENYSPLQKYPLVLTLHAMSACGDDNTLQILYDRLATSWADPVNQAKYPCFVVSPQCRQGQWWSDAEIAGNISDLLDSLAGEFSIDSNRLYVTGTSFGGFGTWDYITRFPGRFAAAIPMSAGWYPRDPTIPWSPTAHAPIWNFHRALDFVVPVTYSRNMIEALKGIGRTVVYTHCHNNDCTGLCVFREARATALGREPHRGVPELRGSRGVLPHSSTVDCWRCSFSG